MGEVTAIFRPPSIIPFQTLWVIFHSFIHSSIHPFTHTFIHPSIHSFIHSFIHYSFIFLFIPSITHFPSHPFTHSLCHSFFNQYLLILHSICQTVPHAEDLKVNKTDSTLSTGRLWKGHGARWRDEWGKKVLIFWSQKKKLNVTIT